MNLKDLDSSKYYIENGIEESLSYSFQSYYYDFVYTSGILEYFKGNYMSAIDSLNKSTIHLDDYNKAYAYFYKKKILRETQQTGRNI